MIMKDNKFVIKPVRAQKFGYQTTIERFADGDKTRFRVVINDDQDTAKIWAPEGLWPVLKEFAPAEESENLRLFLFGPGIQ
jgi:hypothetical protein